MRQKISGLWALFLVMPMMLSQTAWAQAEFSLSEAKEIAATPLSLDSLKKKYRIATAIARLDATSGAKQTDMTLDAQIRALKLMPNVENLCRGEGLSVREYALLTMAISVAMYPTNNPAYRRQMGRKLDDPMDVAAPPEHVQFVLDHMTEIQNGMKEVSAAYKTAKAGGK